MMHRPFLRQLFPCADTRRHPLFPHHRSDFIERVVGDAAQERFFTLNRHDCRTGPFLKIRSHIDGVA